MPTREPIEAPHTQSLASILLALQTDAKCGLTSPEARARLPQFGLNELAAPPPPSRWKRFGAQFKDWLVILLLLATAVSAVLWLLERDTDLPYEAFAILAVVILNAIMGFVQESRAESAAAALREMAAAQATVIRASRREKIKARELVPGDILYLEEGDAIPADGRLLSVVDLQTAEAALTGESLPVLKGTDPLPPESALGDRHNMVFSGTIVVRGHGKAVVTATGMKTEMGKIAQLLAAVPKETTPLQKELDRVGKRLGVVVLLVAIVIVLALLFLEDVRGISGFFDVLIVGVALAVAAVPEGLPAIVTAVLAIGVQRMAKRNAIVRHLAAVETLGSATVIASDKTGTLTRNEMTVRTIVTASGRADITGSGYEPLGEILTPEGAAPSESLRLELNRALTAASRANNARLQQEGEQWRIQGDPTEGALQVAARKAGLAEQELERRFARLGEIPFSSERKLMTTFHSDAQRQERLLVFTKGAPDILLARCSHEFVADSKTLLTPERRTAILALNDELAGEALRTLGVAVRELAAGAAPPVAEKTHWEEEMVFLGLIGMIDPPRAEARQAVAQARNAGIRPILITGDHPKTAARIAQELGIASADRVMTGPELSREPDASLVQTVLAVSVYARVNPEHKLRIVKALQRHGEVVAMTGDGVNDAPALKTADIGVAMGISGTDVSKQAADVILTDDNFASIVTAVKEGRAIFENIRKFLRYLLSSNFGEVLTMFFGVILQRPLGLEAPGDGFGLPLLATQILFINLVTDGAPALALGVDPARSELMRRPPRAKGENILTKPMWRGIVFVGLIMAAGTLLVMDGCLPGGFIHGSGDLRYARTMAFTTLTLFQLFNVFNARSERITAFDGLFTNRWIWIALALSVLLQIGAIYIPFMQKAFTTTGLSLQSWMVCIGVASSVLWLTELKKAVTRQITRREANQA